MATIKNTPTGIPSHGVADHSAQNPTGKGVLNHSKPPPEQPVKPKPLPAHLSGNANLGQAIQKDARRFRDGPVADPTQNSTQTAPSYANYNFFFSMTDSRFRDWIYDGVARSGKATFDEKGNLTISRRDFFDLYKEGNFNGVELTRAQIDELVANFKGASISWNNNREVISGLNLNHPKPSAETLNRTLKFFEAVGRTYIVGNTGLINQIRNGVENKILDTGTNVEALESLLQEIKTPTDLAAFKHGIAISFQGQGKTLEEIIDDETSGRLAARLFETIRSVQRGSNYYEQQAYGAGSGRNGGMGDAFLQFAALQKNAQAAENSGALPPLTAEEQTTIRSIEKLANDIKTKALDGLNNDRARGALGFTQAGFDQLPIPALAALRASMNVETAYQVCESEAEQMKKMEDDHTQMALLIDKQNLEHVRNAFGNFLATRKKFCDQLRTNPSQVDFKTILSFNQEMGELLRQIDIARAQEEGARESLVSRFEALETASYVTIGALAATLTGGAAIAGLKALAAAGSITMGTAGIVGASIGFGTAAGTAAQVGARKIGDEVRNKKTNWVKHIEDSREIAFTSSLGLGIGTVIGGSGSAILSNQLISRGVTSMAIQATNTAIGGDESIFDSGAAILISGAFGVAGGVLESKLEKVALAKAAFDPGWEVAENLATDHLLKDSMTVESVIQSASSALTEVGGIKGLRKGEAHQKSHQKVLKQHPAETISPEVHILENETRESLPPLRPEDLMAEPDDLEWSDSIENHSVSTDHHTRLTERFTAFLYLLKDSENQNLLAQLESNPNWKTDIQNLRALQRALEQKVDAIERASISESEADSISNLLDQVERHRFTQASAYFSKKINSLLRDSPVIDALIEFEVKNPDATFNVQTPSMAHPYVVGHANSNFNNLTLSSGFTFDLSMPDGQTMHQLIQTLKDQGFKVTEADIGNSQHGLLINNDKQSIVVNVKVRSTAEPVAQPPTRTSLPPRRPSMDPGRRSVPPVSRPSWSAGLAAIATGGLALISDQAAHAASTMASGGSMSAYILGAMVLMGIPVWDRVTRGKAGNENKTGGGAPIETFVDRDTQPDPRFIADALEGQTVDGSLTGGPDTIRDPVTEEPTAPLGDGHALIPDLPPTTPDTTTPRPPFGSNYWDDEGPRATGRPEEHQMLLEILGAIDSDPSFDGQHAVILDGDKLENFQNKLQLVRNQIAAQQEQLQLNPEDIQRATGLGYGYSCSLNKQKLPTGLMSANEPLYAAKQYLELHRAIDAIGPQGEISNLILALQKSGFETLNSQSVKRLITQLENIDTGHSSDIETLPRSLGIRQKVRDILDAKSDLTPHTMLGNGRPIRRGIDAHANLFTVSQREAANLLSQHSHNVVSRERAYTPEEMHEILYGVLYRGRPLETIPRESTPAARSLGTRARDFLSGRPAPEAQPIRSAVETHMKDVVQRAIALFPSEMNVRYNPFNGERISADKIETQFHLAQMLLNQKAGQPVIDEPSPAQVQQLNRILSNAFNTRFSSYQEMQIALRNAIDSLSPRAVLLLRTASPADKALILETYFGNFRHRDMQSDTQAFAVSALFGMAGMYREVGMTYKIENGAIRANLTLGDLGSVAGSSGYYFVTHTHPEEYQANDGRIMGHSYKDGVPEHTMLLANSKSDEKLHPSSRNVLPSWNTREKNGKESLSGDLEVYINDAKAMKNQYPSQYSLIYIRGSNGVNTYQNWVFGNYGGNKTEILLDAQNRITKIKISFTFWNGKSGLDHDYINHKRSLEELAKKQGYSIEIQEINPQDFWNATPVSSPI